MVLPVDSRQGVSHHVRVADGTFDAVVAEQFLPVPHARAVLEKVRSRRVPDRVRRNLWLIHAETPEKRAEPFAHARRYNVLSARGAAAAGKHPGVPVVELLPEIEYEKIMGDRRYRHDAIPVELAAYDHHPAREVDIGHPEGRYFRHAESRGVDKLKERTVTEALGCSGIDAFEKPRDLLLRERAPLPAGWTGKFKMEAVRGILLYRA